MKSNLQNRSIYCKDNIDILQGISSKCVDLLYLDPPFNKKKVFTAPIGSFPEGASFKDYFREEDLKDEWLKTIKEDQDELHSFLMGIRDYGNKYNFCYLVYMAIRLVECHRILKDTGSLYLHWRCCNNVALVLMTAGGFVAGGFGRAARLAAGWRGHPFSPAGRPLREPS